MTGSVLPPQSYATCALGIQFVGYVMICFSATNALCSELYGKLSQHTGRVALYMLGRWALYPTPSVPPSVPPSDRQDPRGRAAAWQGGDKGSCWVNVESGARTRGRPGQTPAAGQGGIRGSPKDAACTQLARKDGPSEGDRLRAKHVSPATSVGRRRKQDQRRWEARETRVSAER